MRIGLLLTIYYCDNVFLICITSRQVALQNAWIESDLTRRADDYWIKVCFANAPHNGRNRFGVNLFTTHRHNNHNTKPTGQTQNPLYIHTGGHTNARRCCCLGVLCVYWAQYYYCDLYFWNCFILFCVFVCAKISRKLSTRLPIERHLYEYI